MHLRHIYALTYFPFNCTVEDYSENTLISYLEIALSFLKARKCFIYLFVCSFVLSPPLPSTVPEVSSLNHHLEIVTGLDRILSLFKTVFIIITIITLNHCQTVFPILTVCVSPFSSKRGQVTYLLCTIEITITTVRNSCP